MRHGLASATKLAALAGLLLAAASGHGQELITLETRPGATQSYLLLVPREAPPQAAAVLFPGGAGAIRLRVEENMIKFGPNNFLVRARGEFVRRGVAIALIDAPSDHAAGMHNSFRKGEAHLTDVRAVVADMKKRYPAAPVFLVGTSMGTVSAAYAGRTLGTGLAGVALTATVFAPSGRRSQHGDSNLSDFDIGEIRAPILLVHHREDACGLCPYSEAQRRAGSHPLITVGGGEPPRSGPCEALSPHGFLGREADTVEAMVNWMLKRPYRSEIN